MKGRRNPDGTYQEERPKIQPKPDEIFRARVSIGMTQLQLADVVGICRQRINRIENGECCTVKVAKEIATALKGEVEDFFALQKSENAKALRSGEKTERADIRIEQTLKKAFFAAAEENGESASEALRNCMERYIRENKGRQENAQ